MELIDKEGFKKTLQKEYISMSDLFGLVKINSFEKYKALGGRRTSNDAYARLKENAKKYESDYISLMDMKYSGIPVKLQNITYNMRMSQMYYILLSVWFHIPLRVVSYMTFELEEFNRL